MRSRNGFTLVEILIVVVIIGLLSAVSIPFFMRTKLVSNESVVQADLKSVAAAAEIYRSSQEPPRYPPDMNAMGEGNIPVLDSAIAAGMQHGYTFKLASSADGSAYGCVANPIQFGATGNRSFCIDHEGMLREYSTTVTTDGSGCPAASSLISVTPETD